MTRQKMLELHSRVCSAMDRTVIAVLENGQEGDGSVTLPQALAPYLGGKLTLNTDGTLS